MRAPVVLWDIDGTIVSGSLERHFLKSLRRHGHISSWQLAAKFVRLAVHWPPPRWYQLKLMYLRGKSVSDVESWITSCWESYVLPSLFRGSVEAVEQLRAFGARQVLLSGAPRPLAERLADYLKVAEVIAAEPEIQNGSYSGRLIAPHPRGMRKVTLAAVWLQDNGYCWDDTIAIADHWDDRFLLAVSSLPIALHPDDRLQRYARKKGWFVADNADSRVSASSIIERFRIR